jgi:MerR family transcriptional regulator, light-induced transcriptional regulator
VPGEAGTDLVPDPPEARLTVAAVARRLGVAPATLRTWDRRYGLGPTLHAAGAHRRYSRSDIARLEAMRRLVLDGVPPADAARLAGEQVSPPGGDDSPPPGPSGRLGGSAVAAGLRAGGSAGATGLRSGGPAAGARAGGPGGRVLALPGGSGEVRGLARAAMALDSATIRTAVERALVEHGVLLTWTELLCPVLVAVGDRWASTGEGAEVEHLLAETAGSVLRAVSSAPEPRNGRPVLLACVPEEQHSLPLAALAAALAERGIGTRLLGNGLPAPALGAAVRRTGPAALLLWAHLARFADVSVLDGMPLLRPPVAVLAGGVGWIGRRLPARVTYVPDLASAVGLVSRAVGA